MIVGVPELQLHHEIEKLASPYGDIKELKKVSNYPTEEFTEAYHVHYGRIQSARIAKRFMDGKNFYGGLLHVFYAPELETVSETRAKLIQRRREITTRIIRNQQDSSDPAKNSFIPKAQYNRKKKTPALPLTEDRLSQIYPGESMRSIYDGIPQTIDPRPVFQPRLPNSWPMPLEPQCAPKILNAPYQTTDAVLKAAEQSKSTTAPQKISETKRNYKGRHVRERKNIRLTRPHIIDTRNMPIKVLIPEQTDSVTKAFSNVKKTESGIKIKLLPEQDKSKKRIVIKNAKTESLLQPSSDLQSSITSAKSQIREAMELQRTQVDRANP
ncbi:RNA-binding protein 48 isoform X2 [Athalia rosae]|nr:RNA-binding protein 48 isoform X2 [Athalia rosae]